MVVLTPHFTYTLLAAAVALLPATVSANRVSLTQVSGRQSNSNSNTPIRRYIETLDKHEIDVPTSLRERAEEYARALVSRSGSGSAPLTPELENGDETFLVPVEVGGETLDLKFDTGSPYVWVYSTDLPEEQIGDHTPYDTSSGDKLNQTFEIKFGADGDNAGSITGSLYQDSVTVGDGITSPNQAIEAAANINASFLADYEYDGVLGFSAGSMFNGQPPHPHPTFFHSIRSSLEKPVFATAFKHKEPGTLDIGFIDESKYTGPMHMGYAGSANAWWTFDAVVNGTHNTARIDTGSPLILIDEDAVRSYYAQIPGSWHDESGLTYEIPCDSTPPDLTITVFDEKEEKFDAVVSGEYINLGDRGGPRGLCFGALQWNQGAQQSVFGTLFLKGRYVVFDLGEGRLGFAEQV